MVKKVNPVFRTVLKLKRFGLGNTLKIKMGEIFVYRNIYASLLKKVKFLIDFKKLDNNKEIKMAVKTNLKRNFLFLKGELQILPFFFSS